MMPADPLTDLASKLLSSPAGEGSSVLCLLHLRAVRKARRRLLNSEDPEALHDLRVALRRLRTTLRAYRPYLKEHLAEKTRRRLKRVAAATRESRDLEVEMAWLLEQQPLPTTGEQAEPDTWLVGVENRKAQADQRLRAALGKRFRKLRRKLTAELRAAASGATALATPQGTLGATVLSGLVEQLGSKLESQLGAIHGIADVAEAHQARILSKRLRYLLEPIQPCVDLARPVVASLRDLQDVLGELHDAQVLEAELSQPAATESRAPASLAVHSGLSELLTRAQARRARAFAELEQAWTPEAVKALGGAIHNLAGALSHFHHGGES